MRKILFIPFILLPFLGGCISATIASSGKRYKYLVKPKTSIEKTRKKLGDPIWKKTYPESVPINKTPEYMNNTNESDSHKPFIWGGKEMGEEKAASYCEVYTKKGPFYELERGQMYGMISGLTLGIGDILFIPHAIKHRRALSRLYYSVTFWFDENKKFVAMYNGDIRIPNYPHHEGQFRPILDSE